CSISVPSFFYAFHIKTNLNHPPNQRSFLLTINDSLFVNYPYKFCYMHTVNHILSRKGSHSISVPAGTSVFEALEIMAEKNIGSVVVVDTEGKFNGIVTER